MTTLSARKALFGAGVLAPVLLLVIAATANGSADSSPPSTASIPSTASSAISDPTRYAGTYAYAGTDGERAAISTAVDYATEGMAGRLIARGELMKRSEVRASYAIRFDGKGNVAVETSGFPLEVSPLDGTEVPFKNKYGDVLKNRLRFVDGALVQESRTTDGGGSTRFELQEDGKTLLVTRISWSPKLPNAVHFRLTYVRRTGPP
jgi:hypothetical protein